MGVLDRYFKFADAGDRYLGRMLALLDVFSSSFRTLPAHFVKLNEAQSRIVTAATETVFGSSQDSIARQHRTFHPVLQRGLAAMVYHEQWLRSTLKPDHIIFNTPLFRDPQLLESLRPLVIINEKDSYMTPSGIPSHESLDRHNVSPAMKNNR